mmetsp:Transcript_13961/g.40066  ORF Transcript_13961/g.40066 Transcript_13961/m.40066 type:complete len:236 (-) Transcript_13961:25-732(-)
MISTCPGISSPPGRTNTAVNNVPNAIRLASVILQINSQIFVNAVDVVQDWARTFNHFFCQRFCTLQSFPDPLQELVAARQQVQANPDCFLHRPSQVVLDRTLERSVCGHTQVIFVVVSQKIDEKQIQKLHTVCDPVQRSRVRSSSNSSSVFEVSSNCFSHTDFSVPAVSPQLRFLVDQVFLRKLEDGPEVTKHVLDKAARVHVSYEVNASPFAFPFPFLSLELFSAASKGRDELL